MKKIFYILCLSALHFALSISAFRYAFGSGMARFDTSRAPSLAEKISDVAADVLWFPVALIFERAHFTARWVEQLLLMANSVLWGCLLFCAISFCGKLFHRGHQRNKQPVA